MKQNGEQTHFERNFLWRTFWGASKFFGGIFASKMSFGGRKNYWVKKISWRGNIRGANSFG